MKIFETFRCSGRILSSSLCQFWNDQSLSGQILYPSSVSWKITPLYFFSPNNIYFDYNDPIEVKIFETFERSGQNLSNSLCQFWNDESIPLQILCPSSVSWEIAPLYIFSSNNKYFSQKEHIKMNIFETFQCLGQNSSNSSCHVNVDFKLILFQLWIKGSSHHPNFETLNCSGGNLTYSSCHFPNHKSVFRQILHHPSMSWKITSRYFFRSSIKYFARFSL